MKDSYGLVIVIAMMLAVFGLFTLLYDLAIFVHSQ